MAPLYPPWGALLLLKNVVNFSKIDLARLPQKWENLLLKLPMSVIDITHWALFQSRTGKWCIHSLSTAIASLFHCVQVMKSALFFFFFFLNITGIFFKISCILLILFVYFIYLWVMHQIFHVSLAAYIRIHFIYGKILKTVT